MRANKPQRKATLGKKHMTEKAKVLSIKLLVRILAHKKETNLRRLSLGLGFTGSHLSKILKNPDQYISLIMALSVHLQTNLLEEYIKQLPVHIQETKKEKQLKIQIEELQKQLADMAKERDWLKEVVTNRMK